MTGPSGAGVWDGLMGPAVTDLTKQYAGPAMGERIIVSGRVLDENGRPVPNTMIEIVQANACGRYAHNYDQHDAPLDPNFTGVGRMITDAEGRYRFITVKPGRVSVGQRSEHMAARAYPLLAGGAFVRDASRHADVFPRRSAVPARCDRALRS